MENSYSIYRFEHHDLRDNTDYQLFIYIPKELFITRLRGILTYLYLLKGELNAVFGMEDLSTGI